MLELEVTNEVSDRIAEIGRKTLPAKPAAYDSPEGVLFRKALALIEREENWCGTGVTSNGRDSCSIHAVVVAGYGMNGNFDVMVKERRKIFRAISEFTGDQSLGAFNDSHTHKEVMHVWHEAGHANGWLF